MPKKNKKSTLTREDILTVNNVCMSMLEIDFDGIHHKLSYQDACTQLALQLYPSTSSAKRYFESVRRFLSRNKLGITSFFDVNSQSPYSYMVTVSRDSLFDGHDFRDGWTDAFYTAFTYLELGCCLVFKNKNRKRGERKINE